MTRRANWVIPTPDAPACPLLHFLVPAALLFGMDHWWSVGQREEIVVDRRTAEFLIQQREELEVRPARHRGGRSRTVEAMAR